LGDLKRESQGVAERARTEARRIIEDATAERERLLADADARGFEDGSARGREEGLVIGQREGEAKALIERAQSIDALVSAWAVPLNQFEKARIGLERDARADLIRLAIAIAQRVVRRIVDADADAVAAASLETAIAMALTPTRLVVFANPDNTAALREILPSLAAKFADAPHCEIVDDSTLTPGSCVVRTDRGQIEMRIEDELERIAEALLPGRKVALPVEPAGAGDRTSPADETRSDNRRDDESDEDNEHAGADEANDADKADESEDA